MLSGSSNSRSSSRYSGSDTCSFHPGVLSPSALQLRGFTLSRPNFCGGSRVPKFSCFFGLGSRRFELSAARLRAAPDHKDIHAANHGCESRLRIQRWGLRARHELRNEPTPNQIRDGVQTHDFSGSSTKGTSQNRGSRSSSSVSSEHLREKCMLSAHAQKSLRKATEKLPRRGGRVRNRTSQHASPLRAG